ncbi:hypothetical protein [Plantactinospora sp. WMMB782]|uniref:hypothetical protein n=1 Tax=Plantactinospora sp. WMMB782 TaxID=3404121 RepID=UPI003B93ECA8
MAEEPGATGDVLRRDVTRDAADEALPEPSGFAREPPGSAPVRAAAAGGRKG